MIVYVYNSEEPEEFAVFRVERPVHPKPGHHFFFQTDWALAVAFVKRNTGDFGYPLSDVVTEMVKLGWTLTKIDNTDEFVKAAY